MGSEMCIRDSAAPAQDEQANPPNMLRKALAQFEPDHIWSEKGSHIAKRPNRRESPRRHESKLVTLAAQVGHASTRDALQLASHALIASLSWAVTVAALRLGPKIARASISVSVSVSV